MSATNQWQTRPPFFFLAPLVFFFSFYLKAVEKHQRLQPCYSRLRGSNVADNDYEYKYVKSSALYFSLVSSLLLDRSLRPALVLRHLHFLSLSLLLSFPASLWLRPPCWIMFIIGSVFFFPTHPPYLSESFENRMSKLSEWFFFFPCMSWYKKIINGFSVHDNIDFPSLPPFHPQRLDGFVVEFLLSSLFPRWPPLWTIKTEM